MNVKVRSRSGGGQTYAESINLSSWIYTRLTKSVCVCGGGGGGGRCVYFYYCYFHILNDILTIHYTRQFLGEVNSVDSVSHHNLLTTCYVSCHNDDLL